MTCQIFFIFINLIHNNRITIIVRTIVKKIDINLKKRSKVAQYESPKPNGHNGIIINGTIVAIMIVINRFTS